MEKKMYRMEKSCFLSTLSLSMFTFGGGYVIISLMKTKFVDQLHWINEDEMLDMTAIAQSSPGAIAVNGAIVVGYKLAGLPGVLISVLGAILPPMMILSLISLCYDAFISNSAVAAMLKGMESGIGAVICFCRLGYGCGSGETEELFFRVYYDREFSCLYGVEGECHLDYSGGCGGRSDPDDVV
mgnify:CR=1 FL=1